MLYLYLMLANLLIAAPLPTVHLAANKWTNLGTTQFTRSTDGSVADYPTKVKMKAGKKYLSISFQCEKDEYVAQNYLKEHNEPLFNQEVFEIFIAAGADDPSDYIEIEINPNNAIWVGKINFPTPDAGKDMSTKMVGHAESGIKHTAKKGKKRWSGTLDIPWTLISEKREEKYRFNLYRIVSIKSHPNKNWKCNLENCEFLCWNSTMNGKVPAFHRPKKFGNLVIE
jgi:hypothetical protein